MSVNHVDVHGILTPPSIKGGASPQDELRNFVKMLDAQLPPESDPNATVLFGALRSSLIRLRAAVQCGVDALDVLKTVEESS